MSSDLDTCEIAQSPVTLNRRVYLDESNLAVANIALDFNFAQTDIVDAPQKKVAEALNFIVHNGLFITPADPKHIRLARKSRTTQ